MTLCKTVTPENVDSVLQRAGIPAEPDILSIDVNGVDYWIWRALEAFRPRVVIIEYNSTLSPIDRLTVPRAFAGWDGSDYFGASLGALRALGEAKGYRLVHTDLAGVNAFFVRADLPGEWPDSPRVHGPNYFLGGQGAKIQTHPPDGLERPYEVDPPL